MHEVHDAAPLWMERVDPSGARSSSSGATLPVREPLPSPNYQSVIPRWRLRI
jgi:hypothetical protein